MPVVLLGRLVGHFALFGGEGRVSRLPPLVGVLFVVFSGGFVGGCSSTHGGGLVGGRV